MDVSTIDRARAGDAEAFGRIYAYYRAAIRRYTGGLLRDSDLAEDLTQETFVRAFRHCAQLRPEPQLRAWLYRIAGNACRDALRRARRRPAAPEPPEDVAGPDDPAACVAEALAVRAALAAVRPSLRTPLLLFSAQGLSCREIGLRLQISEGCVGVRLHRARRQFARAYHGDQAAPGEHGQGCAAGVAEGSRPGRGGAGVPGTGVAVGVPGAPPGSGVAVGAPGGGVSG